MIQFRETEFPDKTKKEQSIAFIVANGVSPPRRPLRLLWQILRTAGFYSIFFGVWDCMLLALLLDGCLWAAVWAAAKEATLLYLLVFLASPLLYALLHLLIVWKERMAGMYPFLCVCRLSLSRLTAVRLLLYAGAFMLLSAAVSLYLGCFSGETYSAPRLVSLSFTSLFFYAWIQMLMEWTWMNRLSFAAAPALWTAVSLTLLTARTYRPQILDGIPTAVFLVCAGVFALLYLKMIRTYSFEIRQIS